MACIESKVNCLPPCLPEPDAPPPRPPAQQQTIYVDMTASRVSAAPQRVAGTLREAHSAPARRTSSAKQSNQPHQSPRPDHGGEERDRSTGGAAGHPTSSSSASPPGHSRSNDEQQLQRRSSSRHQATPGSPSPATPKGPPPATTPSPRHKYSSAALAGSTITGGGSCRSPSTPLSKATDPGSGGGISPVPGSARGASTLIKSPYLATGSTKRAPSPAASKSSWGSPSPAKPKYPFRQR